MTIDITQLKVDPDRYPPGHRRTEIVVRCRLPDGTWVAADIYSLDRESLLCWLRSRGGDNPWAEEVVAKLLGHATPQG